ncbi:MAG: 2-phospho-L-lactate guanylyltransferase [Acidimicrobiales bacterium]
MTSAAIYEAVLMPVKAFSVAKVRLAPSLDGPARSRMARTMATRVAAASHPLPLAVVCDDPEVAEWAHQLGAMVIPEPGRGLNQAVQAGVEWLARAGARRVTVAHADLPLARDLTWLGVWPGVSLVPDRRLDGTNVLSVPCGVGFEFSYGPGSFVRHFNQARHLGLATRVVHEPELSWDVDIPADLDLPRWARKAMSPATASAGGSHA